MLAKNIIIDCFPYFNEIALLKARLEYLGSCVDKFLIFESTIDFSGKKRELFFTKENISKLPHSEKIIIHQWKPSWWFIKISLPIKSKFRKSNSLWDIQNKQRNSITKIIRKMDKNAILIFGDLDEFPNKIHIENIENIEKELTSNSILGFSQTLYYYNANTIMDKDWRGTTVTRISTALRKTPRRLRKYRLDYPILGNGWHFSYFSEPSSIKEKILAIADAEDFSTYKSITEEQIRISIEKSQDIYNRRILLERNSATNDIPEDLAAILRKYRIY